MYQVVMYENVQECMNGVPDVTHGNPYNMSEVLNIQDTDTLSVRKCTRGQLIKSMILKSKKKKPIIRGIQTGMTPRGYALKVSSVIRGTGTYLGGRLKVLNRCATMYEKYVIQQGQFSISLVASKATGKLYYKHSTVDKKYEICGISGIDSLNFIEILGNYSAIFRLGYSVNGVHLLRDIIFVVDQNNLVLRGIVGLPMECDLNESMCRTLIKR